MDKQTETQTVRQTDRQIDRQSDRQIDRQLDRSQTGATHKYTAEIKAKTMRGVAKQGCQMFTCECSSLLNKKRVRALRQNCVTPEEFLTSNKTYHVGKVFYFKPILIQTVKHTDDSRCAAANEVSFNDDADQVEVEHEGLSAVTMIARSRNMTVG